MYFPELLAPLLRTLLHLTATATPPRIVISYKIRSLTEEVAFWSAFGLWFTFAPILVRAQARGSSGRWERFCAGGDVEVFVYTARGRPESFSSLHWKMTRRCWRVWVRGECGRGKMMMPLNYFTHRRRQTNTEGLNRSIQFLTLADGNCSLPGAVLVPHDPLPDLGSGM